MDTAPTYAPPPTVSNGKPLLQRTGVRSALRALAVLVGLAGALAGVFFAGLIAAISDCSGDATGLCTNYAGLVPVLEWALVIVAFVAPLAGGIVSCIREEWPWLPAGLVTAAAMVWLSIAVQSGQTALLS